MADIKNPGAEASDEGTAAPAEPPAKDTRPAESDPPAPMKTYEDWGRDKLGIVVDHIGRGSGIKLGKRIPGATRKAAFFNAARRFGRIPLGRQMAEAQFDEAIRAAESIEVKANGAQ